MDREYESLRQEILQWQNRRFQLLSVSIALVTSILGLSLAQQPSSEGRWVIISALLLVFMTVAASLSWYAGLSNAIISAYLMVFHEELETKEDQGEGWESRLHKLRKRGKVNLNLNHWVAAIYLTLGVLSLVIPWSIEGQPAIARPQAILISIPIGLLLVSLTMVTFFSYPRQKYISHWRDIKNSEGS